MKRYLLTVFITLSSFAFSFTPAANSKVFICVSSSAKVYHNLKTCQGLQSCTHKIEEVTDRDAEKTYAGLVKFAIEEKQRMPSLCKILYNNI